MKKILFLVGEDSYFCTHRLNLGKAAIKAGFKVTVATRCKEDFQEIQNAGISVIPLHHFNRGSINPFQQFLSLYEINKIYKNCQPDIVHHVAIKPVIFGSLVARWRNIPRVINALGGLGFLFTTPINLSPNKNYSISKKFKKFALGTVLRPLLRYVFSQKNTTLILQNEDDLNTLVHAKCVKSPQVTIIPGAGIDPSAYPVKLPPFDPPIIIACVARMLWDKGIYELVQAASILQEKNKSIQVLLYGSPDPENPASIPEEQLKAWQEAQVITWKGHVKNIAEAYAHSHIAVLPSYREGLPKSLLEAASCARPIVTTDVPGCREVVNDGENGFLVPAQNIEKLADALLKLCENPMLRQQMGEAGRLRVETLFSDRLIHQKTIDLYYQVAK